MLPFLKKKNEPSVAGVIMKTRQPDETPKEEPNDDMAAIEACAQRLIDAVHSRNAAEVAEALKHVFDVMQAMPAESDEQGDY